MENVSKIRNRNLCVSCEACDVICPTNAIDMTFKEGQFIPIVDDQKCIECGKCLRVCYGNNIETDKVDSGDCIEVYDTYVPNKKIRKNSTSGGVVSRLLSALLEDGTVDGVFVLDFDKFTSQPVRLELIRDSKKVYEAAGSKYLPASVFNVLQEMKEGGSYAIVGTSCQFHSIKEFIKEKNLDIDVLYFGLFCDRTMNLNFIKYMEDRFKKSNENLVNIDYRNKEKRGWPGDVKLSFSNGREVIIDRKRRMEVKDYFMLERCLYCLDKLNRNADISFGDCYLHGKDHPERTSVIVRTSKGKKIFNKYSHLFETNESSIEGIELVQDMEGKKEHLKRARALRKNKELEDLRSKKKKIKIGRNYSKNRLKIALKFSKLKAYRKGFSYYSKLISTLAGGPKKVEENGNGIILITGGGLSNKGAQAMTFTVVSNIKEKFPSHDIYLLNSNDFRRDPVDKNKYTFEILPWNKEMKTSIIENEDHFITDILRKTDVILDISGYYLHSQRNPPYIGCYNYLFNIFTSKKYSIPIYLLPQSIGPFNYKLPESPFLWALQKKYLSYPRRIYPREEAGVEAVKKFTSSNVERRHDIVLTDGYEVSSVYEGEIKNIDVKQPAAGIVPNTKVSRRIEYDMLMNFYKKAIEKLRKKGFNVYLIRHSNQDLSIIKDLKSMFSEDEGVISVAEELYAFELEELISDLEFMIASRYHSIIHAYRNGITCLVLGWAVKYQELLTDFDQSEYIFDVRKDMDTSKIFRKLEKLTEEYSKESKKIKSNLKRIRKEEGEIFDEIFL